MKEKKNHAGPAIADYDKAKYDYEEYWKGRAYEDMADKKALERFLKEEKRNIKKGDVYIDVGGSYGRETALIARHFNRIILFDYSLQSLKKGKVYLDKQGITNVVYVAGNVYYLPFKNNTIFAGQMVRVMHHLKQVEQAFLEIDRVITGFFILEFANKMHFKHASNMLFHGDMKGLRDRRPYQQKFRETAQGSKGQDQIFLNFHPSYIKEQLTSTRFSVYKKLSVSNLRSQSIKKVFTPGFMLNVESFLQSPLAAVNFGPSMYLLLHKRKMVHMNNKEITDLFCCPKCKGSLSVSEVSMKCGNCKLTFPCPGGIFDLRYQPED